MSEPKKPTRGGFEAQAERFRKIAESTNAKAEEIAEAGRMANLLRVAKALIENTNTEAGWLELSDRLSIAMGESALPDGLSWLDIAPIHAAVAEKAADAAASQGFLEASKSLHHVATKLHKLNSEN